MRLTARDVAGETAEVYAVWDGTGSGRLLSKTALWAIIGASAAVVLIIVIVVVVVVCRKKGYSNPPE